MSWFPVAIDGWIYQDCPETWNQVTYQEIWNDLNKII